MTSCILGESLTVHGDGSAARDFLHVADHCRALDKLIHLPHEQVVGQVINLGTERHVSVLEIAHAVRDCMDADVPIELIGDRPGQVFRHTANAEKARQLLDWAPELSFEAGLKATAAWYQENRSWWERQLWLRHIPIVTARGRRELH